MFGLKRKLADTDFLDFVKQYDVIFLCETWLNRKETCNLDISGYQSDHIFGTKSKTAKRGRYSGGLSVYYKTEFKNKVKVLEKSPYGFLWLKIKGDLFHFQEDVILGHVYFPDSKSKIFSQAREEVDHFEILENYVTKFKQQGKIFITGDFNSRCGSENSDILSFDKYLDEGDESFVDIPFRISKDHVTDTHGRNLLSLCQSVDLCIANGRLEGGEFTYCSQRGQSVVDYLLTDFLDFKFIKEFKILSFNEFSDHAPLVLMFSVIRSKSTPVSEEVKIDRVIWDDSKADILMRNLQNKQTVINNLTSHIDHDSVDKSVLDFTSFMQQEVSEVMSKTIMFKPKSKRKQSSKWFDQNCVLKRRDFINARNTFLKNKTEANRLLFTRARTCYNRSKRKAHNRFKFEEGKRVCDMARSRPRDFWKNINKHIKVKQKNSDTLTGEDFFQHFQKILSDNSEQNYSQLDDDQHTRDTENRPLGGMSDFIDPDLDGEIMHQEVRSVISSLKTAKSPGLDNLVAEIFKATQDMLLPYIVRLFNKIFLTGEYPESWCTGVIVPIYKNKGDIDSPNNYRGITLTNVLAKIFSHVLLNRINKWSEKHEKINCNQFGFQKAKSTIDCIFIFNSIISKVLNEDSGSKKLYCTFIDYEKAFDKVDRYLLWFKLLHEDISPRMLKILKSMYKTVKSCIKYNNKLSNYINSDLGVKQGDPLSPILFMFFINDIVSCVNTDTDMFSIDDIYVFMLLYADDAVVFAKSAESLQNILNNIQDYCNTWNLTINTSKTKVMVFEKGRHSKPVIYLNGIELEVVTSFKYLGVEFF